MLGIGAVLLLVVVAGVLADGGTLPYASENDKGMELNWMPSTLELYPLDGPVKLEGIGKVGVATGGFVLDTCGTNGLLVSDEVAAQGVITKDLKAAGIAATSIGSYTFKRAGGVSRGDYQPVLCDVPGTPSERQPDIAAVLAKLDVNALLVLRETGSMSEPESCSLLGGCNGASSSAQLAATLFARDGHVSWNGGGFADAAFKRPNPVTWALRMTPSVGVVRVAAAEMTVRDLLADSHK